MNWLHAVLNNNKIGKPQPQLVQNCSQLQLAVWSFLTKSSSVLVFFRLCEPDLQTLHVSDEINHDNNVLKDIHQTVMCLGTDLDNETKTAPGSPDEEVGIGSDLLRGEDMVIV